MQAYRPGIGGGVEPRKVLTATVGAPLVGAQETGQAQDLPYIGSFYNLRDGDTVAEVPTPSKVQFF